MSLSSSSFICAGTFQKSVVTSAVFHQLLHPPSQLFSSCALPCGPSAATSVPQCKNPRVVSIWNFVWLGFIVCGSVLGERTPPLSFSSSDFISLAAVCTLLMQIWQLATWWEAAEKDVQHPSHFFPLFSLTQTLHLCVFFSSYLIPMCYGLEASSSALIQMSMFFPCPWMLFRLALTVFQNTNIVVRWGISWSWTWMWFPHHYRHSRKKPAYTLHFMGLLQLHFFSLV